MHNARNRVSLSSRFSLGALLAATLGSLMGKPHEIAPVDPSAGLETDPFCRPGRYRGDPYSATPEARAQRFALIAPSCRPPARRHYGPRIQPLNKPKRMKDRRKWRKANGYHERAVMGGIPSWDRY